MIVLQFCTIQLEVSSQRRRDRLGTEPLVRRDIASDSNSFLPISSCEWTAEIERQGQAQTFTVAHLAEPPDHAEAAFSWVEHQLMQTDLMPYTSWERVSPWSRSAVKRAFDCACVLLSLPIVDPVSPGDFCCRSPYFGMARLLFHAETHVGRHRTGHLPSSSFALLFHVVDRAHHPITASDDKKFLPPSGRFLRRWRFG